MSALSYPQDFNLPARFKTDDPAIQTIINNMLFAIRWLASSVNDARLRSGSGAPSYTPTDTTQPYMDITNLRLYYYVNSAWHYVTLT